MREGSGSPLAQALSAPLSSGSLDAALRAARAHRMRHAGDDDAKRVVEALELLQSQVWLGGADGSSASHDARYAAAAQALGAADLDAAIAIYQQILDVDPSDARASELALRAHVVVAASRGERLPADDGAMAAPSAPLEFDDSTRVAGEGELPLGAFQFDDVTANVDAVLSADAFRDDEPTRDLELVDLEVIEDGPESTRVAGPGELPLDEIKRQFAGESDEDLDLLLDEIEQSAPALEPAVIQLGDDAPPSRPASMPRSFKKPSGAEPPSAVFRAPSVEELEAAVEHASIAEPAAPRGRFSTGPPAAVSIPSVSELGDVHHPVATDASPEGRGAWEVREPGGSSEVHDAKVGSALSSWSGLSIPYDEPAATFEPGVEDLDADSWDDPTEIGSVDAERVAEAAFARGDLSEALRLYQDIAAQQPDEQRLWDRVAEIARLLQQRSGA